MYVHRNSNNKLLIENYYQPKSSFLSPVNKFGHRSFSASSLYKTPTTAAPLPGSLREQIRLEAFKKNLNQSKLSKTAFTRAPLKVQKEQKIERHNDVRYEVRELQKENSILRQENGQLKQQRVDDLHLIQKQNQLLHRLEQQMNEFRTFQIQKPPCECYLMQQQLLTIRGLQIKNKQLEEEKKQYRQQIRDLVVQQEQLKAEIERFQKNQRKIKIEDNKKQQKLNKYQRKREVQVGSKDQQYYEQYECKRKPQGVKKGQIIDRWSSGGLCSKQYRKQQELKQIQRKQKPRQDIFEQKHEQNLIKDGEGVRRYFQYLKNKQIDRIANIFKKE